jgi:beta-lactamase superfamily II metal-dependent hydrolase
MAMIVTHSRVVLFDTGDTWGTRGARLRQLALPALDALGTRTIDLLVLPRLDADRAQGAALLAFERTVRDIRVGGGWPASRLGARACADERFRRDGVDFELSATGPGRPGCELRIRVGDHSVRFAEKWIETGARLVIATGGQARSRPRKFVLDRWRASGARHFDTRDDGAIEIGLGTQGIVVTAVARASRYPFAWRRFP